MKERVYRVPYPVPFRKFTDVVRNSAVPNDGLLPDGKGVRVFNCNCSSATRDNRPTTYTLQKKGKRTVPSSLPYRYRELGVSRY